MSMQGYSVVVFVRRSCDKYGVSRVVLGGAGRLRRHQIRRKVIMEEKESSNDV